MLKPQSPSGIFEVVVSENEGDFKRRERLIIKRSFDQATLSRELVHVT